jgi:hypothetical protein
VPYQAPPSHAAPSLAAPRESKDYQQGGAVVTSLAYPHVLVPGTPENVSDVEDNFQAIKTWANGNVDATNLAATADPATLMGAYRPVAEAPFYIGGGLAAGTYYVTSGGFLGLSGLAQGAAPMVCPINLADHAVSGLVTQFRIQASTVTNATAPGVSLTFQLCGITASAGGSGAISVTLTAPVAGSGVTRTTPASGSNFIDWSSDFTGSNGTWPLSIVLSGTTAAASFTTGMLKLMVHNI